MTYWTCYTGRYVFDMNSDMQQP